MQIIKKHFSSFERQVTESIYIEVNQRKNILNSKSGFNRCLIPRLSVMMGEKEHTEQIDNNAYSVDEFDNISRDKTEEAERNERALKN